MEYDILHDPPYFLKLLVESKEEVGRIVWHCILQGDAQTKVLCDWTRNKAAAVDAYESEKARYVAAKAGVASPLQ